MKELPTPTYYRQRFLLKLLEMSGGNLSKIKFQKLLFISQQTEELKNSNYYDFVPLQYGCYSFQANADIFRLESLGWLKQAPKNIKLVTNPKFDISNQDMDNLNLILDEFRNYSYPKLMKYVYENYPYYAIYSKAAKEKLDDKHYQKVKETKDSLLKKSAAIFTIGYEGRSFEAYANLLIENDVRVICDLRNNPLSRKFGFSKSAFEELLGQLNIGYYHLPELGIKSGIRQNLNAKDDYRRLFKGYRKSLETKSEALGTLIDFLAEYKRIGLTCFELDAECCHRHCVSDYLKSETKIAVNHL